MSDPSRFLVGVHFRRYFGGPGHLAVTSGGVTLTDRKGRRAVTQPVGVVRVERKRFEPPTGNHWIEVTDGYLIGHATMSRRRADQVVAALLAAGFAVERTP